MDSFRNYFEELTEQLGDNYDLSSVLEFISYFRCSDIELYKEFNKDYDSFSVGYYSSKKLVNLYCKYNGIELNDENASVIFENLVNNIWDNNMSYHLTTTLSAENIYQNGMDPSKKEEGVIEDIEDLYNSLSDESKGLFMPYVNKDKDKYCFSYIPKFNNNYGRKPEWYLNLTLYNRGSLDEILTSILSKMNNDTMEAKDKMCSMISKYYEIYSNSSRKLVIIPGLTDIPSNKVIAPESVNTVSALYEGVQRFIGYRSNYIDEKSDKVVPSENLMFIDMATKKTIDFNNRDKKM